MDKPLEDLVGDTKLRYYTIALRVLHRLFWLWDRDYRPSSPDFGNFESLPKEERKPHNHNFKAASAWSISSGKIESGPGALLGFKY